MRRTAFHIAVFALLTVITQIGGFVYACALLIARKACLKRIPAKLLLVIGFYSLATVITSFVAPLFGRVPLPCFVSEESHLVVRSPLYCALNRNYVTPELKAMAMALAQAIDRQFPGTTTIALDSNFPFVDGFPLLPHLSHDDGRKLDFAYYYDGPDGRFMNGATRSPIGYFAFEQPKPDDEQPCAGRTDWLTTRWDFLRLQSLFPDYPLDRPRTVAAINWLVTEGVDRFGVEKLFLEPHLKTTFGITDPHVRFQGCRAARHDDHIHVQLK